MGLDVYVYRYEDFEATIKLEAEYNRRSDLIWDQVGGHGVVYNDLTDAEKDEARKQVNAVQEQLGLGKYGEDSNRKTLLELPSTKYPEHYFKIGYFRSSYNSGGFNSVVSNIVGSGLGEVFDIEDDYIVKPDWMESKERATCLLGKLNATIEQNGSHRVMDINIGHKWKVKSSEEALEVFVDQKKKNKREDAFRSYSCLEGDFFLEGINIVAMISGEQFGSDYMFCVYEADLSWYIQALEIVIETIEYVLEQEDTDKYYLHWSG